MRGLALLHLAKCIVFSGGDCLEARDMLLISEKETKQARTASDVSMDFASLTLARIDCALAHTLGGLGLHGDAMLRIEATAAYWARLTGGRGTPSSEEIDAVMLHAFILDDFRRKGEALALIDAAYARFSGVRDPESQSTMDSLQLMRQKIASTSDDADPRALLPAARARLARALAEAPTSKAHTSVAVVESLTVISLLEKVEAHREVIAVAYAFRKLRRDWWQLAGPCGELEIQVFESELRALSALGLSAEYDAAIARLEERKIGGLMVCAGPGCSRQRSHPECGALNRCGGCGRAAYCCAACQRAAWKGHKAECKAAAAASSTAEPGCSPSPG